MIWYVVFSCSWNITLKMDITHCKDICITSASKVCPVTYNSMYTHTHTHTHTHVCMYTQLFFVFHNRPVTLSMFIFQEETFHQKDSITLSLVFIVSVIGN